jgi:ABC-type transport system substrate-binding protein
MSRYSLALPSRLRRGGGRCRVVRSIIVTAMVAAALAALAGAAAAGEGSNAATPKRGGALKLLGTSDIFNLDTVSAYSTINSLIGRTFARQLLTYQSAPSFTQAIKLVPDIATAVPAMGSGISADAKTYTFTLRDGVMWDTTPPREVTASDFVREFKTLCNPASPVGAPGYYTSTILGMEAYCQGFAKIRPTVAAINAYIKSHRLDGVVAPDAKTVVFKLTKPAPDFLNIIAMSFSSARPVEYEKYVPDSAQMRQHTISNGPYKITSYVPTKSFALARNSSWKQASDPVRHAWVDSIQITEGLTAQSVQQQIEAGSGDMEWDVPGPPAQDLPRLIAAKDKRLVIGPSGSYDVSLPYYLVLNQYAGPMKSKLVRQAVATAVNKRVIVQLLGGSRINSVSNQMILPGNVGYVRSFNANPANTGTGNPAASKALLKQAGYANGLAIKFLSSTLDPSPRLAQALQSSLNAGGFKVEIISVTQADFYAKYLYVPSTAKRDVWDIGLSGWVPDWFGNNGRSVLQPLFTGAGPGSTDFGGYDNPVTSRLVESALTAKSQAEAAKFWTRANVQIMKDAGAVPLVSAKAAIFNSSRVQGCNFFFWTLSCDLTRIWLE